MFNSDYKEESIKKMKREQEKCEGEFKSLLSELENFHFLKEDSLDLLENVIEYLEKNKENLDVSRREIDGFRKTINNFNAEIDEIKRLEDGEEIEGAGLEVVAGASGGIAAGAAVAALGPTAAMAIATTFGTASTGVAIAGLSGAASGTAALAWLGGGALAVGGGGVAAGEAALALLGPIGWAIGGTAAIGGALLANSKNLDAGEEANERASMITREISRIQRMKNDIEARKDLIQDIKNRVSQRYRKVIKTEYNDDFEVDVRILIKRSKDLSEEINKKLEI